jgi:hypothetical protein
MKKNNLILIVILCMTASIMSCSKDTKDVSSVTTYPQMTLVGDQYMCIAKGTAYTEPGVTATIGGSPVAYTTVGTVNSATPGVYILEYTAINSEGFSQSAKRFVGVIAPDAAALNFSGNWKRTNGVMTTWTKSATHNGLYVNSNIGGVDPVANPSFSYPVRMFNVKDSTLVIPLQPNPLGGELYCTTVSLKPSVGLGQAKWVVMGSGYGTSVRTFDKQ